MTVLPVSPGVSSRLVPSPAVCVVVPVLPAAGLFRTPLGQEAEAGLKPRKWDELEAAAVDILELFVSENKLCCFFKKKKVI